MMHWSLILIIDTLMPSLETSCTWLLNEIVHVHVCDQNRAFQFQCKRPTLAKTQLRYLANVQKNWMFYLKKLKRNSLRVCLSSLNWTYFLQRNTQSENTAHNFSSRLRAILSQYQVISCFTEQVRILVSFYYNTQQGLLTQLARHLFSRKEGASL